MLTKVKEKTPIVIPLSIQRKAGIKVGDDLEFKVAAGVISIRSKSKPPEAEDSPETQASILAQIKEARNGPYSPAFASSQEAIQFLGKEIRKRQLRKSNLNEK
jgi:bifunctional DNA-binding transcriptional regulator/antitoxin component of YhaV-PrlF toxin-antitoxin module